MRAEADAPGDNYQATLTRLTSSDLEALAPRWRALESRCDCSFFQSWSWMGSWLAIAIERVELYLFECRRSDETVALATLSRATIRRRHLFRVTQLTLNDAPPSSGVSMNIEYNDLLALQDQQLLAWRELLKALHLSPIKWDELALPSITQLRTSELGALNSPLAIVIDEDLTPWSCDITSMASNPDAPFERMSKNRRWQIRRSLKEYEKEGALEVDEASTIDDALQIFAEMEKFHTERWQRVGQGGSFANARWPVFHRKVIESAFNRHEIQLLRIRCGARPIGYIYSFVWRRRIYMLQTGFAQEASNVLRPGYVSHLLSMQLNARIGNTIYDFMWGDAEYKSVLAEPGPQLHHIRMQRQQLKLMIENGLVWLYRKLRATRD